MCGGSSCRCISDCNPRARVGRDPRSGLPLQAAPYFNPRAPRGGRRAVDRISKRAAKFQSTRPCGARPITLLDTFALVGISIHAPAWGNDPFTLLVLLDCHDFNPHAPHGGATCRGASASARAAHFNPRARVGRDVPFIESFVNKLPFQSTRPRGARPD